jgi:N-acetylglucosaminyldiphosphoundecaprenol N-acetyl-beta-D-mannosaminyltransferase
MTGAGPERLFRLAAQPRRLWKRYLKHNPGFAALSTLQLSGLRHFTPETRT